FVPDIACHLSNWVRSDDSAYTEQGAVHDGMLSRGITCLLYRDKGCAELDQEFVGQRLVPVLRRRCVVKPKIHHGGRAPRREVIDEVGADAVRWFLVARRPDSQLVFDIDLARSQSLDNPVYYVQLSHARICGLMRHLDERGLGFDLEDGLAQPLDLSDDSLRALLIDLSRWPEVVATAGAQLEPHLVAAYLLELAQGFQSYYNDHQFLVDEAPVRNARLALALAVRQVLANGLGLLGVSAPERM